MSRPGAESEFLRLVEAHQGIVHRTCALYASRPEDRDDLRQEILMHLWRSFPTFRGSSRFSTWMFRVALNTALTARRRLRSRPPAASLDAVEPPASDAAPRPGPGPTVDDLQVCIRELPEIDRAVILLYLERHTHEEIAELTGLSRKNVGVRIVRIKQRLRRRLLPPAARGPTP